MARRVDESGLSIEVMAGRSISPVMTSEQTCRWLGYPSVTALMRARKRGDLPVAMFQLPGRRGWFAATQALVAWAKFSTTPYLFTPPGEED